MQKMQYCQHLKCIQPVSFFFQLTMTFRGHIRDAWPTGILTFITVQLITLIVVK